MLWIIIPIIIGFIIGCSDDGFVFGFFLSIFGFVIGALLILIGGGLVGCALPQEEVCQTYDLVALQDNIGVEGHKYLFNGYIEDKLKIRYIINTEKGKHIQTIDDISNVYINDNSKIAQLKVYEHKFKYDWFNWIGVVLESQKYVFYVPEGTIITNYEIDLM